MSCSLELVTRLALLSFKGRLQSNKSIQSLHPPMSCHQWKIFLNRLKRWNIQKQKMEKKLIFKFKYFWFFLLKPHLTLVGNGCPRTKPLSILDQTIFMADVRNANGNLIAGIFCQTLNWAAFSILNYNWPWWLYHPLMEPTVTQSPFCN